MLDDILSSFCAAPLSLTVITFIICHNDKPFNAFHKIHVPACCQCQSKDIVSGKVLHFHDL